MNLTIHTQRYEISETVDHLIREHANRLERVHPELHTCIVTVEGPGDHHQHGGLYDVRIDITLPGHEVIVNRKPSEKLSASIREAFAAARRQIEEFEAKRRGPRGHERRHPADDTPSETA